MPFTIVCPNCDARLTAPETVLGKKVKCKKCDEPFVAKRAAAADDEDERPARPAGKSRGEGDEDSPPRKTSKARRPADDGDAGDEDEPRPKAKKKGKKKKQGSPGLLVALVVIGAVVLIGGGLGVYFGFIKEDKSTESTAGTDGTKGPPAPPKGPPGGPVAGGGAWVEHVDAEGKYRISFPGRPTAQSQTVNAGGAQHTTKVTQLQAGIEVFVANAVVIPPGEDGDPEKLLDNAEQQAGTHMQNATVTSKQPVTHAGVNGRELVLSIQSPAGVVTGVVRLFVANGRIYTFGVVGPTVQSGSPNVVKYFESLKFE